ncbi:bifunctional 4-hydroxy-2-oxoglutarate aldolase/2-dehydro-3-deoxy-phosphogluconate aldolase [Sediminitomix flava]|uniref:2-dehydro-3-deoxyphosphogluconate aldolase/(4S)-4-hydroxy-2-oxoglutarate aldolase n=1 Tax=Sediminitomix flava TaxID=379075 RepID=A0A315Z561_SEDFL|nr:bifunctional 4-hydroxy-2-oxoglutarate aldolase/2-dehydro-3-deoxy-phosphogluconate aldolase [Sediminitomix flava]PWJ37955.1 2-dehydro-3-deoxyphosphogluconate aldolase/(4S)-4-hydroxy-2-oxoglutarate aldolase [Sediminitomix flava]
MAKFSRIEVVTKMKKTVIVPVFFNADVLQSLAFMKTVYEAGVRVFEFTNRAEFAHELFAELIKKARIEMPDLAIGIGSIVDAHTAAIFIQNGADFIVSPLFNDEIGKLCNRRKIAWFPGCSTVSEVSDAHELGAEVVKIFPANAFDAINFIKGIKAPMPWTDVMPTGGVKPTIEDLTKWLDVGVSCVGIGSNLVIKDQEGNWDYDSIFNLVSTLTTFVESYRKEEYPVL